MIIGIPSTVNFTDASVPGKDPFVVQPNTSDGPISPNVDSPDSSATQYHTSIVLPGMGLVQYGSRVISSMVHMLEHFASPTPPVVPTIGQIWYDTGLPAARVWDGTQWVVLGGEVSVAQLVEYNALATAVNLVIGVPSGTTPTTAIGYNQALVPILTTNPTTAQWTYLIQLVRHIATHQGVVSTGNLVDGDFVMPPSSTVDYGLITVINRYNALVGHVGTINTNRLAAAASSLETALPNAGLSTRTVSWSGTIQHNADITFTSQAHMYSYFNAGGSINFSASQSDASVAANARWQNLLASLGTIKLKTFTMSNGSATVNTGMYTLPTVMTALVSVYQDSDHYMIKAMINPATFTISVEISFTDHLLGTGGPETGGGLYESQVPWGTGSDIISGTTTSQITLTKASELNINNPEIAYPTIVTTRPLSAN